MRGVRRTAVRDKRMTPSGPRLGRAARAILRAQSLLFFAGGSRARYIMMKYTPYLLTVAGRSFFQGRSAPWINGPLEISSRVT
jgi:hypothetical protein